MASSSTGLDPLGAHRQPNRTASPVKRPANDHQQVCPDPCGAFVPWQEGQKGASFYLYLHLSLIPRKELEMGQRVAAEDLRAPARRIAHAVDRLSSLYNMSGGVVPELAREFEGIQLWMWVPSLYSVIEQGMKLLIRSRQKVPRRNHRLRELYDKLHPTDREYL